MKCAQILSVSHSFEKLSNVENYKLITFGVLDNKSTILTDRSNSGWIKKKKARQSTADRTGYHNDFNETRKKKIKKK